MATQTPLPDEKERLESSSVLAPVAQVEQENDGISIVDLLDALIALRERWRTVLRITVIFAISAIAVSLILPRRYTAKVTLLPPQQNSSMSAALTSQLNGLGSMAALTGSSLGLKNPNDMFVAMLKGRTVEDAMVQQFELMKEYHERYLSDARKKFENHATVDGSGKDGLIHISFEDADPNRAAEIANGYVAQFRSLSEHLAITEASQRRLFFEQQLLQAKDNLANAEEALKQTEQKTGLIQLDSQTRALIESAASLRAQIAGKEVQIQGMQTYATGQNSQVVQAQQELESMRAQLAKLGGTEDSAANGLIVPKGSVPQAGLEYIRKVREVKYSETIFDILARQFEIAKLDEAKQGSLIQVVDAAVPPDKPSFPRRGLIILVSTIAGLLIGMIVALTQSHFEGMKDDPEVIGRLTRLRRRA